MGVLLCRDINLETLEALLKHYSLNIELVESDNDLPGSFWKAPEAGLIGDRLFVREDTPVHSALHEACHYICMDNTRRQSLHTDAGGDFEEEDAVCYLQIILADMLPEMGHERMLHDMDEWGYTFRLGSARNWFNGDAEDAEQWLLKHSLLDKTRKPIWCVRQSV